MAEYVLFTESTADLTAELVQQLGVEVLPMLFSLDGKEYNNYPDNRELDPHDFYDALRAGGMSTTSQINQATFEEAFSPVLEAGKDILYLAFSSGLSGTYHSACLAAEELAEKYPERTVRVIDTLQASMGEGLAVYYAATLKNEGKSLAEVADWFEANKMRVCAWFTVDDLNHLKRGGRVSPTVALVGTMLGIKPLITIKEGKVAMAGKARGLPGAYVALFKKVEELGGISAAVPALAGYTLSAREVQPIQTYLQENLGRNEALVRQIGCVIGTHAGPGAFGLAFLDEGFTF